MRVRATRDGTYGGYYREGPVDAIPGVSGGVPGEVFDIDDKPYPATDPETGKPVMEPVLNSKGDPIIDNVMVQAVDEKGNPVVGMDKKPVMNTIQRPKMKQKMWSWFAPEWMEKVAPDTPITYDEAAKAKGVHPSMKIKKPSGHAQTFSELSPEVGKPIDETLAI